MTHTDLNEIIDGITSALKETIDELRAEIDVLKAKAIVAGPAGPKGEPGERGAQGEPGTSISREEQKQAIEFAVAEARQQLVNELNAGVEARISASVTKALADAPRPKDGVNGQDGRDGVPLEEVKTLIAAHVAQSVAALPVPTNGTSVTVDDVAPLVAEEVQKAIAALPAPQPGKDGQDGQPGKDGVVPALEPIVAEAVQKAVDALPKPKDGAPGKDGKDGVGLAGTLMGDGGTLIVTLSDGTVKDLGPVKGKDGAPGPKGEAGEKGAEGRDGSLEQLKVLQDPDDPAVVRFCFKNGDLIDGGLIRFPVSIYKGVYADGVAYKAGDGVTWAGSMWVALSDTTAKPGLNTPESRAWRLAVKKGSDGKAGRDGDRGPMGPMGPKGERGYGG